MVTDFSNFSRTLLLASAVLLAQGTMQQSQAQLARAAQPATQTPAPTTGASKTPAPKPSAPKASQGANYAGTASSATWISPNNATGIEDGNCANNIQGSINSINLTNFSFSIPAGSAITGILVEPKGATGGTDMRPVQLLKAGTTVGNAKAWSPFSTQPSFPTCPDTIFGSLGGAGDTWGVTWTPSDINASNFGCLIADFGTSPLLVDAVRITVFFDYRLQLPLIVK